MHISLCNITQGDSELSQLKRMISSVKDYVTDIYITTNGPHTKTKKWLESKGYHHSHLKWTDDFSAQRNFNVSQLPKKTDYYLWLDTDDVLVGGEYLQKVAELAKAKGNDTVFFAYWYGCEFSGEPSLENLVEVETHHPRERLIKPGKTKWKGRLHETPVELEGINYSYSQIYHTPEDPDKNLPIAVLHLGANRNIGEKALAKRMARNRRILESQLKGERESGKVDPRTLLYLMKIYSEGHAQEDLEECIKMGEEYMQTSGWDEERATALMQMAKCYGKLGADKEAVKLLHSAAVEHPHNPLIYLMLAEGYYNLKLYRKMTHWMEVALNMKNEAAKAVDNNVYQLKVLSAELMLKRYLHVEKNVEKAEKSAKLLNHLNPTKNNKENLDYLTDFVKLNDVCSDVDGLAQYLGKKGERKAVFDVLESLPPEIKERPFVSKLKNKYCLPRAWKENEICYFANFGGEHFEKWDYTSLDKGIGGSETAVIHLSREWAKKGYKVTVYGDPTKNGISEEYKNGSVVYEPYWKFNRKDKFNIFIQWRDAGLSGLVSAKKFYVDLHDVTNKANFEGKQVDGIMVKSKYHAKFLPGLKTIVIGNGI